MLISDLIFFSVREKKLVIPYLLEGGMKILSKAFLNKVLEKQNLVLFSQ